MKIGICDDEIQELSTLSLLLQEYKVEKNLDIAYSSYQSPMNLIHDIQQGMLYDILILDVVMPLYNGIELAQEIRNYDKKVKIIFLTSSTEFALQSYAVEAYYYAIKPVWKDKLFSVLDKCIIEIDNTNKECIFIKCKNGIQCIHLNALEYCEIINKTMFFHMSTGLQYESLNSMNTIENQLSCYDQFIKPHRSFMINMDFISRIGNSEVEMQSGTVLPIPRGKFNIIKELFLNYSFRCNK